MRLFNILSRCLSLNLAVALQSSPVDHIIGSRSESSPNPIASLYPEQITGTINGTLSIVPIPYDLARSIIPAQCGILTKAYYSLLKDFPPNSYPLYVRGAFDHGVGVYAFNFSLADFQSIHILYPFVDLLGDGYSSFAYNKYLLISANNTVAIAGATEGGEIVPPSSFSPDLEAYGYAKRSAGEIYLDAYTNLSTKTPAVTTRFEPQKEVGPWPISFYKNITNQPIFANELSCDNQITLFNTSLSTGKNAPVGIRGRIKISPPYFPVEDCAFDDVFGIKVDVAFVEYPGILCATLKGYHGTGSGD